MRHAIVILLLLSWSIAFADNIVDMGFARDWCDRTMLRKVEGIWEYPTDHTRVLVRRSSYSDTRYDIVVVESADTRLTPGETIGYLQESPSSSKFEMGLYRTKTKGKFNELGKCLAEYNSGDDAIIVKSPKLKVSLSSRWFLPNFWRALKVNLSNPIESLPQGMVRIYPENRKRQPSYL